MRVQGGASGQRRPVTPPGSPTPQPDDGPPWRNRPPESGLEAITGVTRPPPLAELSQLLGVRVTDVAHVRVFVGGRPQLDPNAWRLTITGRELDNLTVLTRRLRDPWWLNRLAAWWGRDPDLPALTREDARRALRLMHQHVERTSETEQQQQEDEYQ